jgi:hypothetical protein
MLGKSMVHTLVEEWEGKLVDKKRSDEMRLLASQLVELLEKLLVPRLVLKWERKLGLSDTKLVRNLG